jgi:hypothetical protein
MRLADIDWTRTPEDIRYSQYLRRSDGIWCRALQSDLYAHTGGLYRFQYMYQYPAPDWPGGLWSHSGPLNALELSVLLQHCTGSTHRQFPWEAQVELRVPKDHFLPWTEEELDQMLPVKVA